MKNERVNLPVSILSPNKSVGAWISDDGYATNLLNLLSTLLSTLSIIIVVPLFDGGFGLK